MAKNVVVLGMQWGDEGKGKIVDMLTDHAAAVVRYQGGNNAGHTLIVDGKRTILRLIPSGILHPGVMCLIGHGVVVSPTALLKEIDELREKEVAVENRLRISPGCQLILPYHIAIDLAREQAKGDLAIGTTGRGIGPAYEDKVARRGLRLVDLNDENYCCERLRELAEYHNFILKNYYHQETIDPKQVFDELYVQRNSLLPLTEDITVALREVVISGGNIIFEGAQGTLLDVDVGTYPYVTSSNTTAGAVATGSGFGPRYIDEVWGVTKAYTTRVGAGPFPTELFDDNGKLMGERGHEFGSVTGRARRCGWLDGVLMRRAIHLNSVTAVVLTKLDILDVYEKVFICVAYRCGEKVYDTAPIDYQTLTQCEPVYEEVPGWQQNTLGLTRYSQLPKAAQHYIRRLEELSGVPVTMISTGPERSQTIIRQHPFT